MHRHSSTLRIHRPLILLLFIGSLWALVWTLTSALVPSLAREALPTLQARLEPIGIGLGDVAFSGLRISPWLNGLVLSDLEARLDLNPRDRIQLRSQLDIATLEVRLTHPFSLRGAVQATGLEVRLVPSDRPRQLPFDRFSNVRLAIGDLPLGDPRQAAKTIRGTLKALFLENHAIGEVAFSGEVILDIDGVARVANLYTERAGETFKLRFREEDIRAISQAKGLDLVPEQIEIVSLYPLRAPVILMLTDRARALATRYAPDDVWLKDAMRHVIWSFLLTRTFGSVFATRVTDAQELRPGNTPDERAMDYHNNAIGRRFVAENVPLAALPRRVRKDPDVIRHPDEVEHFGADRLLR
ncbi:MAG: hypothetical protein KFB96_10945 [Thiocapsa sp.]|uniref:DUF6973 domain-containing protein n=1 Tax=Thiocapsa sp. TaxID=2024551 RepID=UPI001BCF2230|nr:hypothetical protein [Thiocapsa sp.]QVL50869.1 MAG: hypothetical protein KFB96_10945 [Thiocapsa sp.]